jgi:hypothetical protein
MTRSKSAPAPPLFRVVKVPVARHQQAAAKPQPTIAKIGLYHRRKFDAGVDREGSAFFRFVKNAVQKLKYAVRLSDSCKRIESKIY